MVCWLMPEQIFFEGMAWAPWQSGSMTTFSFESHEHTCAATMHNVPNGTAKYTRAEGGRLWYGGKDIPGGLAEEFDEDCSATLHDFAHASP